MNLFKKILLIFIIPIFLQSCGGFKKSDVKDNPINYAEKRKKNIEEGRGITFGKGKEIAEHLILQHQMKWRASMEMDFIPLAVVDYSGGVIITDWYSDSLTQMKL